jgi:UDP-glucose 4-epimerase
VSVLVTGGAGYVGSHAVKELRANGIPCVVLDNLSRGRRELVLDADLIVGDVADTKLVERILSDYGVQAVMHFAAYAYVGESMQHPARYYQNNVASTIGLLDSLARHGVKLFVFSSTCATYGLPQAIPITEEHAQQPVNPYGASKLMVERILRDFDAAYGMRSVVFRYFNAAGADPDGRIGEMHDPETHLIPLTLDVAIGKRDSVEVYGSDYPTPDGTCIRDYIHVSDLAQAHVLGLRHLQQGAASCVFNLGNGNGFSVREVIETVQTVTGTTINTRTVNRRRGDPHQLVGSSAKAREVLGWSPRFAALDKIVETAWRWHKLRA